MTAAEEAPETDLEDLRREVILRELRRQTKCPKDRVNGEEDLADRISGALGRFDAWLMEKVQREVDS